MSLLDSLGLHRRELRAWAMYDWANSAAMTTIITAVFPTYFSRVASADVSPVQATARLGLATTIGMVFIAVLSPFLGPFADRTAAKKRLLGGFVLLGSFAVGLLFFVEKGDWRLASFLFIIINIALNGSFVFYDALLPHIANNEEMDRVSTAGYALGYVGGGVLLALNLAWILHPAWFGLPSGAGLSPSQATLPSRLAFLSVAVWWLVFSIPLFRHVPEPAAQPDGVETLRHAVADLWRTLRDLLRFRQAALLLVAFLLYSDGIGTIIRMATAYGTEIGIGQSALIGAILLVQFIGIPFAFLFGALAKRIGAKRSIFIGLVFYCGISLLGYAMTTATHFYLLAILVAMVQGGTQALSRSLFASLIPRSRSASFFSLFSVMDKVAGFLGPAVFTLVGSFVGSSRLAVLAVMAFFILGGAVLSRVDVAQGQRMAQAEDAAAA
jgi:UMF1 family MFS transporter